MLERHARVIRRAIFKQGVAVSRDNERRELSERCDVGAGDGLRTRYLDLGKVALYQVSYSRSDRGSILPARAGAAT